MIVMDVRPAHDGPGAVITTPGHTAAGPSSTTPTPPPPPARAPSRSRIEADVCAVALATCALCPSAEFFEITDYVTEIKTNLELPNASLLCCLMMYAQSLMLRTEEGWTWHAALTAGTVLACKSVFDEAFCLSDMLDATSDKYTLAELEHLEFAAVQHVQLTRIPERLIRFRAGLLQVMLVQASVLKLVVAPPGCAAARVLVLDDDEATRAFHTAMVQKLNPDAVVIECSSLDDARPHIFDDDLDLALVDLQLSATQGDGLLQLAREPLSGFGAAGAFRAPLEPEELAARPLDAGAPLVAMVTDRVMNDAQRVGAQNRGADVVINKPLTIDKLRALMAMTWGLASQEMSLV